ncbi:Protein of unknown function [Paenacidovorax caeni]|uniref:Lcl C-terminal domain-containing protein n=1 Tax=Paenacidovorax caeni TaxID=343013 RepID=A0A1I7JEA3_9BURK|nr:DUF1566 domain-containing protein [Paenacidovorax caeni]SFU83506.1 Protein of unknown function [Paenacidovorax caeni]
MNNTHLPCLIGESACARPANGACPKCGMDANLFFPSIQDRDEALEAARARYTAGQSNEEALGLAEKKGQERKAAQTAWQSAKDGGIEPLESFLAEHPNSIHSSEALRRLQALRKAREEVARAAIQRNEEARKQAEKERQQREAVKAAWQRARTGGTAALEAFLVQNPDSTYSGEARRRLQELREEQAGKERAAAQRDEEARKQAEKERQQRETVKTAWWQRAMEWFRLKWGYSPAEVLQRAERRYAISTDGQTVTDKETGLMWMRCSLGQSWDGSRCAGEAREYTWDDARKAAQNYRYAGYSDWRLPDIEELSSLVYCSSGRRKKFKAGSYDDDGECLGDYHRPTIFSSAFPNASSSFVWSGSPNANDSSLAWGVNFYNGYANYGYRSDGYHVRLVRGGQ